MDSKRFNRVFVEKPKLQTNVVRLDGRPKQFVYFDDPNELVQRLRLLVSEKEAGNTSVDSEIVSIIEELVELKIIINKTARTKIMSF